MKEASKAKKGKIKYCAESECKSQAVSHGYCRLHYIAHWKDLKDDDNNKAERRLDAYVERMTKKYPKDFMERIKEGLENEEKFKESVEELELDREAGNAAPETDEEFLETFVRKVKIGE